MTAELRRRKFMASREPMAILDRRSQTRRYSVPATSSRRLAAGVWDHLGLLHATDGDCKSPARGQGAANKKPRRVAAGLGVE